MIESPFGFFQMKIEFCIGDAFEFGEPDFVKAPETFNAFDMHATF